MHKMLKIKMYNKLNYSCMDSDSESIFNLSFNLYELPFILNMCEWCNNLSNIAFASVTSLNISCHLPNGLFVVIIV